MPCKEKGLHKGGFYMGLIHSYALWNNKGGVGKSTITFHLSMRYAELHPEQPTGKFEYDASWWWPNW